MQKRRVWDVLAITVLVGFVFGTVSARADLYMKQKNHTGSFTVMGKTQPEKDDERTKKFKGFPRFLNKGSGRMRQVWY